jgi:AraC-like DNA-binding protein
MRRSRLQMAARLLIEKKITVSEVSTLVGFNSHSYFCSCFKAIYGCSPTEYVERNENN